MLFTDRKPKVYIETTVVSYLAARLSRNATIADRQQTTRQFWAETDATHIAIAAVHNIEYLATWNYKHIINIRQRRHIGQVCDDNDFRPAIICTPAELIEVY